MPIYEYVTTDEQGCPHCRVPFEVVQTMSEPPLEHCKTCGGGLRKVFSTTAIHGESSSGHVLSNKNLSAKGFTKYQKAGDGHYEKVTGKGPDVIQR